MKTNSAKTPIEKAAEQDAVPPGYKRTEVGVIPEDWDVSKVGAEFTIQLGKMLDAAKNVGVLKPYVGNRAVQWGRIDLDAIYKVLLSQSDIQRFRLEHGDLLVCEGGEIGRAAIWDAPIPECYYQKAIHRLRAIRGYSAYLMMSLLQYWNSNGHLANYVTQTSIAHLPKEKFEIIPIPVPPPAEQRAIAEALSDVDGLIAALDKLIAKKRAIKQAAMQQLLTGKTRLPGFSGEWEMRPFATSLFRLNVKQHQIFARDYQPFGKYPVIDQGQVPVVGFTDRSDKLFVCPSGGVIVFGDHTCIVKFIDNNFVIGADGTQILVTQDEQCARFYAYLLQHDRVEPTGYNRHFRILRERSFRVPLPPEQNAIAKVLSDMDAEIEALEQRRAKTQQIKQGMMEQLLTGRVRLV